MIEMLKKQLAAANVFHDVYSGYRINGEFHQPSKFSAWELLSVDSWEFLSA